MAVTEEMTSTDRHKALVKLHKQFGHAGLQFMDHLKNYTAIMGENSATKKLGTWQKTSE